MILAVDTETTGSDFFHGCAPFMVTACDGKFDYVWTGHVNPKNRVVEWDKYELEEIQKLLDSAKTIVFHNTNFDMRALDSIGIKIDNLWDKIQDSLVAAHALNSTKRTDQQKYAGRTLGLKDLALEYLGYPDDDEDELIKSVRSRRNSWKSTHDIARYRHPHFPALPKSTTWAKLDYWLDLELCEEYGVHDARRTFLLWKIFEPALWEENLIKQYSMRRDVLQVCYDIQTTGRHFYRDKAARAIKHFRNEMKIAKENLQKVSKLGKLFDPDKPSQLSDLLFNQLKLEVTHYTAGNKPKLSKDVLKSYVENATDQKVIEALSSLSKYKQNTKKINDIENLLLWTNVDSRTHSFLNVTGTRETRQSSTHPNSQNTNKNIKSLFGPEEGYVWISIDFVNIEVCVWSYTTGNKKLIEVFETGRSFHLAIMEAIFPTEYKIYIKSKDKPKDELYPHEIAAKDAYGRVKNGNFALLYGATRRKINETYHGGPTKKDYYGIIDREFPGVDDFMRSRIEMCENNYKRYGLYSVTTLGGYRLAVPPDKGYMSSNFFNQGSAGYIMNEAMVAWFYHPVYNKYGCKMIDQTHDSLDTEVKITDKLKTIIDAKIKCIKKVGEQYLGTLGVSWELIYHTKDKDNPILLEINKE